MRGLQYASSGNLDILRLLLVGLAQGNEPMSTEYNGYRSSLELTVSTPYAHRFSPSWDHLSVAGSKS